MCKHSLATLAVTGLPTSSAFYLQRFLNTKTWGLKTRVSRCVIGSFSTSLSVVCFCFCFCLCLCSLFPGCAVNGSVAYRLIAQLPDFRNENCLGEGASAPTTHALPDYKMPSIRARIEGSLAFDLNHPHRSQGYYKTSTICRPRVRFYAVITSACSDVVDTYPSSLQSQQMPMPPHRPAPVP
jgi:hypothetical protein